METERRCNLLSSSTNQISQDTATLRKRRDHAPRPPRQARNRLSSEGLCIWREIPALWAGLREKPRSLGRFSAKSQNSRTTIGSGRPLAEEAGRGRRAQRAVFVEKRLVAVEPGGCGLSSLVNDGPRGVSGAGRRQPALGSPRRGGREVPETVPGLSGGVSRQMPLSRGTAPSAPPAA